jgi:hypothetical protein
MASALSLAAANAHARGAQELSAGARDMASVFALLRRSLCWQRVSRLDKRLSIDD